MEKPPRTFWQMWNMSVGFLGIQFGWGLQMAKVSAICEYLGERADQVPFLWLAAPLTGLIVQPIIGHASDHTWSPSGRRRPYFLAGAVLSSIALVLMPRSSPKIIMWIYCRPGGGPYCNGNYNRISTAGIV
jgi:maltose/moltooligosaccharide transporter